MKGFFIRWSYRDGGSFSRTCESSEILIEEAKRAIYNTREVIEIKIEPLVLPYTQADVGQKS